MGSTVRCEISGRSLWSSRGSEKCNGHDVHVNTIIVAIAIVWVALVTLIAEIDMLSAAQFCSMLAIAADAAMPRLSSSPCFLSCVNGTLMC